MYAEECGDGRKCSDRLAKHILTSNNEDGLRWRARPAGDILGLGPKIFCDPHLVITDNQPGRVHHLNGRIKRRLAWWA